MYIGVHGMGCVRSVYARRSDNSVNIRRNHNIFCSSVLAEIYSASHVLSATVDIFLEHQLIGAPYPSCINLVVDFRSAPSAKSASEY